jgi:hypothetical protein
VPRSLSWEKRLLQAQYGTAKEAKAMLMKAVAAVKADKTKALGFQDRDLYPFCANVSDGKIVALGNPLAKQLIGGRKNPKGHHQQRIWPGTIYCRPEARR